MPAFTGPTTNTTVNRSAYNVIKTNCLLGLTPFSTRYCNKDSCKKSEQNISLIFTSVCRSVSKFVVAEVKHLSHVVRRKCIRIFLRIASKSVHLYESCLPRIRVATWVGCQMFTFSCTEALSRFAFFLCRCSIPDCIIFHYRTYCTTLMVYTWVFHLCVPLMCIRKGGTS